MSQGFFDVHAKLNARRTAPAPTAQKPGSAPLTVSQLTARIDRVIRAGIPETVHVRGEISNYRPNRTSGHVYFTLKDDATCIDCVMWQSNAARIKFSPKDGMELIVTGRVTVYGV